MKKVLYIVIFCLLSTFVIAQSPPVIQRNTGSTVSLDQKAIFGKQFGLPAVNSIPTQRPSILFQGVDSVGAEVYNRADSLIYRYVGLDLWLAESGGKIPGGPFTTSNTQIGFNPGNNLTIDELIRQIWYAEQPPTITLTGGTILELTSAGSINRTLSLNACRGSNTTNLIRITIHGSDATDYPITFSNPSQNACTGTLTQVVPVPANTTTVYTDTVTTLSGLQTLNTTQFTYQSKMYVGFITNNSPSDADIIAASNGTVGGFFNNSQRLASGNLSTPSGSDFIVIAYPASWGLATIKIGGFATTYNLTVRSFINTSGATVSYNVYVSPFATAAGVSWQVL